MMFPSNTFNQEPLTGQGLAEHAKKKGVEFFISERIDVNGACTHPVYAFLRQNSALTQNKKVTKKKDKGNNSNYVGEIPWNYAKFLVNAEGKVVEYFPSEISPSSIVPTIEKYLR